MKFIIRNATINDAESLFEMTKLFHEESRLRNEPYINTLEKFIKDCFNSKNIRIKILVAEFKDNILGYCSYLNSYALITGPSVIMPETFIKKEYRKLGISIFLYSKIFDVAYNNKSTVINWGVNLLHERTIKIEEKMGAKIERDTMVLNIDRNHMKQYINHASETKSYDIHFVKSYELPDVFNCIQYLAEEINQELQTDIYKIIENVSSSPSIINIIVATRNDEVIGFISFYESYYTNSGKKIIIDVVYVIPELRKDKIAVSLLAKVFEYAYDNNFNKVESFISKYEVEKIEGLKEYGIYPYDNLRRASFNRESFKELYKE